VTTQLDLADIQGTILRGYRVDFARHFVLEVVDAGAARAFLGSLVDGSAGVPQITTAARWTVKPQSFLNVGLTAAGLVAFGQPVDGFPATFQTGATDAATAQAVGDVGASAPAAWAGAFATGAPAHVVLSLWAHRDQAVLEHVSAVLRRAFAAGLRELGAFDANALPGGRVHFGYADGISQPTVEGAPPRKRPMPDCQPVAPTGEFLLGYPTQNAGGQVYSVTPAPLSTNSSFAAFRMLEQDVAGFEDWLQRAAAPVGIDPELLAAKICGRWRSGAPLVLSPDTGSPSPPIPRTQINDYDYVSSDPALDDTFGFKCPVGAHMRRANPRGEQVVSGGQHLHRIVRRAMPYGPAYDADRPVQVPRGLIGYFINADIANQFEFLMSQWINGSAFVSSVFGPAPDYPNPVNNISGSDVMLGANDPGSSSFVVGTADAGTGPAIDGFGRFITTRGGAYCYLPSISALRYISAGGA
jgi:Dyp-type peroxidase family